MCKRTSYCSYRHIDMEWVRVFYFWSDTFHSIDLGLSLGLRKVGVIRGCHLWMGVIIVRKNQGVRVLFSLVILNIGVSTNLSSRSNSFRLRVNATGYCTNHHICTFRQVNSRYGGWVMRRTWGVPTSFYTNWGKMTSSSTYLFGIFFCKFQIPILRGWDGWVGSGSTTNILKSWIYPSSMVEGWG